MSTLEYYEKAFKSSSESASAALGVIKQKLSQFTAKDKRRSSFSYLVFRGICKAVDAKGNFFDSYCAALKIILKYVDPSLDGWSSFFACLKYFHYELCRVVSLFVIFLLLLQIYNAF